MAAGWLRDSQSRVGTPVLAPAIPQNGLAVRPQSPSMRSIPDSGVRSRRWDAPPRLPPRRPPVSASSSHVGRFTVRLAPAIRVPVPDAAAPPKFRQAAQEMLLAHVVAGSVQPSLEQCPPVMGWQLLRGPPCTRRVSRSRMLPCGRERGADCGSSRRRGPRRSADHLRAGNLRPAGQGRRALGTRRAAGGTAARID